jgi:hypothetical protein
VQEVNYRGNERRTNALSHPFARGFPQVKGLSVKVADAVKERESRQFHSEHFRIMHDNSQ